MFSTSLTLKISSKIAHFADGKITRRVVILLRFFCVNQKTFLITKDTAIMIRHLFQPIFYTKRQVGASSEYINIIVK